jgi:hypothetical protein
MLMRVAANTMDGKRERDGEYKGNVCLGDKGKKEGSIDEGHAEGGGRVERDRCSKRRG